MSPSAQQERKEGEALSAAAAARKAGIYIPYINICIYVKKLTISHVFGYSYFHFLFSYLDVFTYFTYKGIIEIQK
jgi:hypothetical protein